MASPTTTLEEANWAVDRATGLPEVWALGWGRRSF
jgi:hypothetical protein